MSFLGELNFKILSESLVRLHENCVNPRQAQRKMLQMSQFFNMVDIGSSIIRPAWGYGGLATSPAWSQTSNPNLLNLGSLKPRPVNPFITMFTTRTRITAIATRYYYCSILPSQQTLNGLGPLPCPKRRPWHRAEQRSRFGQAPQP